MMKKTVLSIAALFACLVSGNAFADTHPLMGLDLDQDGFVSQKEAEGMPELAKAFEQIDINKDGKLDKEEISAYKL